MENLFSEMAAYRLALHFGYEAAHYEIVYNAEDARACRRKGVIRTRDFTRGAAVNLEPAASLGLHRDDIGYNYKSLQAISPKLADQYFNIVTLDTLIYNLDRHTHNFGVLRDATTGEILSLAPNYDNNLSLLYGIHGMQKRTAANDVLFEEWKVFVQSNFITAPLPELTQAVLHDILSGIDCGAAPEDIARAETFILAGYDMMQRALLLQPEPVEHEDVSTDKAYLETGLPPSIQKAIREYVQGEKDNVRYLDCLWGELYGAINASQWDRTITIEQADYLRGKYLMEISEEATQTFL